MAGTKRSAPESEVRETRSSKNPKTNDASKSPNGRKATAKGGRKGARASLAPSAFKSKALPLHVNITHTPPAITVDDESVTATSADPGTIGGATLVPTEFSTGSYGWKGSKRVTIEIPNPDGGEGEKVQVMISINATVVGSKNTKDDVAEGTNNADEGTKGDDKAKEDDKTDEDASEEQKTE